MQVARLREGKAIAGGAIIINEPSAVAPEIAMGSAEKQAIQEDGDYARQLQAKMDVQEARGAQR